MQRRPHQWSSSQKGVGLRVSCFKSSLTRGASFFRDSGLGCRAPETGALSHTLSFSLSLSHTHTLFPLSLRLSHNVVVVVKAAADARFWPWLYGKIPSNVPSCSFYAGSRANTAHISQSRLDYGLQILGNELFLLRSEAGVHRWWSKGNQIDMCLNGLSIILHY